MTTFLVELHCKTDQYCLELLQSKSESLLKLSESFRLRIVTSSERKELGSKQRLDATSCHSESISKDVLVSKDLNYFQPHKYFRNLYSKRLGHLLAYSPQVSSTQDVARILYENLNVKDMVVVAETQTKGRGRRTNQWQTELGSLAFSTVCSYSLYSNKSNSGASSNTNVQLQPWRSVSFIQYLVALAIVEVVKGGKYVFLPFLF